VLGDIATKSINHLSHSILLPCSYSVYGWLTLIYSYHSTKFIGINLLVIILFCNKYEN